MSVPSERDCAETFHRLADYLDRELTPEETALVERHIALCADCAAEYRFEESLLRELKAKARSGAAPRELRATVLEILAKARAEGE